MKSPVENSTWFGASHPALIFELVGTASFVTKPEQYISDSVGPPPEVCAAAGIAAIAKSVAVVSKPLSFIHASDVSRSTSPFSGGGKTLSRRPGEAWEHTRPLGT